MKRDVILALTTAVLFTASVVQMYFVVPVFRGMLDALGATVSVPARLAIAVSHFGLLFFAAGLAGLAFAFWKDRQGSRGRFSLALALVALLAAVYLALVTAVYLDYARLAARIH